MRFPRPRLPSARSQATLPLHLPLLQESFHGSVHHTWKTIRNFFHTIMFTSHITTDWNQSAAAAMTNEWITSRFTQILELDARSMCVCVCVLDLLPPTPSQTDGQTGELPRGGLGDMATPLFDMLCRWPGVLPLDSLGLCPKPRLPYVSSPHFLSWWHPCGQTFNVAD